MKDRYVSNQTRVSKTGLLASCMASAIFLVISALLSAPIASAESPTVDFNIPAQPISSALRAYAHQAKVQLLVLTEGLNTIQANAVVGRLDPQTALQMLLAGTGLHAEYRPDATVAVKRGPGTAGPMTSEGGDARPEPTSWLVRTGQEPADVMMAQTQADDSQPSQRNATSSETNTRLEEIIVTGTRIKGVTDQFSPVTQFSREEMDLAGFNNVSDIFESLPQNFGGGVTVDTSLAATPDGPGGASVNLRGLGNEATLILLNGHRLAAAGLTGNFVDVSSIPTSAIERVEILTDGASAVYGADAIAGVVNIILRDDFDGAETRLNVGTIPDGGSDHLKVGQTLGWNWDRAHAMLTYEYSNEEELDSTQKAFALKAADPSWLLPFTEKHSAFASTGVQLSDHIKLSADGYFGDRRSKQFTSGDTNNILSQTFQATDAQQYGGALGIDVELGEDWAANLSGSYARSDFSSHTIDVDADFVADAANTATEILSLGSSIGGPLFDISDNQVRGIIGAHYRSASADLFAIRVAAGDVRIDLDKSRDVFAVFGEIYAPIISESNSVPGIESLAITAAARYENHSDVGSSLVPKVGLSWSPTPRISLRGTYGKSFRAPRVDQIEDHISFVVLNRFVDIAASGGESIALNVNGTTSDLDPETSTTWTVGFDFSPDFYNGLLVRGTYFNTVFNDQVGLPSLSVDSLHRYIDFDGVVVRDVSPATVQDLCALAAQALGCFNFADLFPAVGDLSFEDVEVLLDSRFQNLSLSKVAGIDLEVRYESSSTIGDWRVFLAGTLLTTFEHRVAPATPANDLLNTFGNPVDWKLRSGVHWRNEPITAALFINHVGDYTDDKVPTGDVPIDSFTTVDATIRLKLGELWDSRLAEGASLSFSVLNMLNVDPPFISETPHRFVVLDSTNSNPVGRKVGLLLTKRW